MSGQRPQVFSLMSQLAKASGTPADRDETLALTTRAAQDAIPGADYVSVSVKDAEGKFQTLAPTGEVSLWVDQLQYELGEGPCLDAAGGEPIVHCRDLRTDPRWPHYAPRVVREFGIGSQVAYEMYSGDMTFGGLNLYSRQPNAFDEEALSIAELFASQGALALGHAATVTQLTEALASRKLIGQAIGLVMERYELDEHRAFQFLARVSMTGNLKLRVVAEEIVAAANEKTKTQR